MFEGPDASEASSIPLVQVICRPPGHGLWKILILADVSYPRSLEVPASPKQTLLLHRAADTRTPPNHTTLNLFTVNESPTVLAVIQNIITFSHGPSVCRLAVSKGDLPSPYLFISTMGNTVSGNPES